MRSRVAVLASGSGSNLQCILEHFQQLADRRGGDVVVVASDRAGAGALERAVRHDLPGVLLATPDHPNGATLDGVLEEHRIDLIVLAGYLRLVPPAIVHQYEGRIVNVHPALLPAFGGPGMYGRRVHRAVIESGARVTGVTAHFIDAMYDRGRIIAQWPVPVFSNDDADTLAARVLRVEHLMFPRVVDAVASGRTTLSNCAMPGNGMPVDTLPSFTLLPHEDARLAENIELTLGC